MAYILGITGASGAPLAKRVGELIAGTADLVVTATPNGERVFRYECGLTAADFASSIGAEYYDDMFAPVASGSYPSEGMVIVPCSMSSAGKLANGCGDSLTLRAADVCLKERRRLVIVPRETPMHGGHLRNLAALSDLGAVIDFPVPQFYDKTRIDITDAIAGHILKSLGIDNNLRGQWK